MNTEYLEKAKEKVPDVKELILLASKRAAELAKGAPACVKYEPKKVRSGSEKNPVELELEPNFIDIALQEIAEGKVIVSYEEEVKVKNTVLDDLEKAPLRKN